MGIRAALRRPDPNEDQRILHQVWLLLEIIRADAEASDEDLVAALHRHGVETRRARRLVVFVPMAFGRDLASRMHVRTRLDVSIRRADGSWVTRPLQAFPEFRVAEELTQQLGRDDYSALARRSAEVAVISKALDDGSGVEGGEVRSVTPWDLL